MKILALSLLATNLQMDGVTPELKAVTREALHQRSYFYEVPGESQRDGLAMLAMLGIYNRSILAGAVVGLGHGIDSLPDFAKRRGNFEDPNEAARWKAWKPTRGVAREACWFRDETGSFEACMFRNNVEKLKEDLSHGTVTIRYMNPNLGEDEFNAILEQAGWGETQNTTSAP